jgi:hypothetical protein
VARPGTLLLRLAIDSVGKLIAISVSLEGEALAARVASCVLPSDVFDLMRERARKPGTSAVASSLTERLAAIDVSPALGELRYPRVIVLPSSAVARFPIAALGPPGSRLLDRADEITWLPNLFALRAPSEPNTVRSGGLMVAPRDPGGTRWHDLALAAVLPDEHWLRDEQATLQSVEQLARTARTISFYAHGSYVDTERAMEDDLPAGPSVTLACGDRLQLSSLLEQWNGVARVELWACESGINLPMDPLGVLVDEAFGLDYEFLRVGARSAIGSLYAVAELVTAVQVSRYRQRLLDGASSPRALADAQRTWIERDMHRIIDLLREDPVEGLARFAFEHGVTLPKGAIRGGDATAYQRLLSCPALWAAFRFVGVNECVAPQAV